MYVVRCAADGVRVEHDHGRVRVEDGPTRRAAADRLPLPSPNSSVTVIFPLSGVRFYGRSPTVVAARAPSTVSNWAAVAWMCHRAALIPAPDPSLWLRWDGAKRGYKGNEEREFSWGNFLVWVQFMQPEPRRRKARPGCGG
jgi:hypothetical protein